MPQADVIVIGAGLGGLTAGAKLAKAGKKVLLIEQHSVPGGCATTFKRGDFQVEAGLHMMCGWHEKKEELERDLELFKTLQFIKISEYYRFTNQKIDITLPTDSLKIQEIFIAAFPKEKQGIKQYFKVIRAIYRELKRMPVKPWKSMLIMPLFPLLYPHLYFNRKKTITEFMDKIITDDSLKMALTPNHSFCHHDPSNTSMLLFAIMYNNYLEEGSYFIKGGSQKLSDHLAKIIETNGGQVLLSHLVTRIITHGNKAIGVEYKPSQGNGGNATQVLAKCVVANTAIPNVANQLLVGPVANKLKKQVNHLKVSPSLSSIYLGFKNNRSKKNLNYSTFVYDQALNRLDDICNYNLIDYSQRCFLFTDYRQIDSGLAPANKGVGVICFFDSLSDWENLSKIDYKAKKETVAHIFIQRLDQLIPGIKQQIEYYEVATPKTLQRYTLNPRGAVYGFAAIPSQTLANRVSQKSPVKNLYFASSWTRPAHGFSGSIMSGFNCAIKVLEKCF